MNVLKYRVSLDMFDALSQTTIKAKKCDSACQIHITLTEHGKIYNISEGSSATFNAKKTDGTFVYDKCSIEGNTIVYDFRTSIDDKGVCQVSACEGNAECEVTLYNANGEQLTSPRFTLFIDGTVYNGEEIISSPEANALKELINEIKTKLDNGEITGKDAVTDQTYNPKSENAQSGKAVAEAVKTHTENNHTVWSGTLISGKEDLDWAMSEPFYDEEWTKLKDGDFYINSQDLCLYKITYVTKNEDGGVLGYGYKYIGCLEDIERSKLGSYFTTEEGIDKTLFELIEEFIHICSKNHGNGLIFDGNKIKMYGYGGVKLEHPQYRLRV